MHKKKCYGNVIILKSNPFKKKKKKINKNKRNIKKKGHSITKKKIITPFFQTMYIFHFLFILSDLKSYGHEVKSSTNYFGREK